MSKEHTLPDGFYKIPYSNAEYFVVKNNLVKRVSINNSILNILKYLTLLVNQTLASGILYTGFDFMPITEYLAKTLVPLTSHLPAE